MSAFTAVSSLRAAATRSIRASFEAFASPAALWIASRSAVVSHPRQAFRLFAEYGYGGASSGLLPSVERSRQPEGRESCYTQVTGR